MTDLVGQVPPEEGLGGVAGVNESNVTLSSKTKGAAFKCFIAAVILVLLILVLMNAYDLWPSKEHASNSASAMEIVNVCRKNTADKLGLERAAALTSCVADVKKSQERYTAAVANVNHHLAPQPTNNYVDIPKLNATDEKTEHAWSGHYVPTGGPSSYQHYDEYRARSPYSSTHDSYGPPRYLWKQHYDAENMIGAEAREHAQGIRTYLKGAEKLTHNGPAGRAVNPLLENMSVQQGLKEAGDNLKKTVRNVGSALGAGGSEKASGSPTDKMLTTLARGGQKAANALGFKSEKAAGGFSDTERSLLLQSGLQ